MTAISPDELVAQLRSVDPAMRVPPVDVGDVRKIVALPLRAGGLYVELYAAVAWSPVPASEPAVSVFQLVRDAAGTWRFEGGSSTPIAGSEPSDIEAGIAHLEITQAIFRPRPIKPRASRSPRRVVAALTEAEGAAALASTRGAPRRATDAEVDQAERMLGTRLPAGYRTYVTALGDGLYGGKLRVSMPDRVVAELVPWRDRIERFWFWGDAPLGPARALECIRLADTIDGDELVFHPTDPDALVLLPRHSERSRHLGRGLAAAITKLVRAKQPDLVAH